MKCTSCGREISDTAKFCSYCGASVVQDPDPAFAEVQTSFSTPQNNDFSRPELNYRQSQGNTSEEGKGMGIAGMVLGIITIVFCWIIYISFFTGIIGIILSVISNKKNSNGYAKAGLATSIIGLVLGVGLILLVILGTAIFVNSVYL